MKAKWMEQVNSLLTPENWLVNDTIPVSPEADLSELVEAARQEWLMAQRYYDYVSDPDLVDHAVYQIQAAEKKYSYLLKLARKEGITHSPFPLRQE